MRTMVVLGPTIVGRQATLDGSRGSSSSIYSKGICSCYVIKSPRVQALMMIGE